MNSPSVIPTTNAPSMIVVSIDGARALVTLARGDVRNAFNEIMIAELTQTFDALAHNDQVRVIVLAAQGKAFCAGADLNWMKRMANFSESENRSDAMALATMLRTIHACPKPVIARVQGDCYAGGMGLVAACDIVVSSDSAGFCLSEVRLGLIPATISPYVIRAMGTQAAQRYFLTAERFDALEALRIGFVHEISAPEALDACIDRYVATLLANSPHAMRCAKQLVHDVATRAIDDTLVADTADRIASIRASDEGREGVRSFLEKRKPGWLLP